MQTEIICELYLTIINIHCGDTFIQVLAAIITQYNYKGT